MSRLFGHDYILLKWMKSRFNSDCTDDRFRWSIGVSITIKRIARSEILKIFAPAVFDSRLNL